MYSIGEFSRIGSVSTKTLRYYDEIGLLQPIYVDEDNHYRYYAQEQVDKILLISELKKLDLRLEQIKAVMESDNASLLEHFLTERVRQIDDQMQQSDQLRQCIEKKIREIQLGGTEMEVKPELTVEIKEFEPVWVMSKMATIDISQIGAVIGSVFEEAFRNGLDLIGPVMTFYPDEEFDREHANVEVCIPVAFDGVSEEIPGIKTLDVGLCATCTYRGVYSDLGKAYASVMKWIKDNNRQVVSAPFEIYVNSLHDVKNPHDLITQVWFPINRF